MLLPHGCEVRVPMTRLSFAAFTELEMMSCCTRDQLFFGDLGLDIDTEAAVRVPLCRLHLAQPALVALEHLRLVGNRDLRVDDDWKIKTD